MYTLRIIFILTIFLLPYLSNAQKTEDFNFMGAPGLSYNRTRSTLHVIDQRINKENVGHIKAGFNKMIQLKPTKPIEQLLSSYYGNVIGNEELLLVLYDFDIVFQPNDQAVGTFYFSGDFFSGHSGNYKFIQRVDSIYEVPIYKIADEELIETARAKITDIFNWYGNDNFMLSDTIYSEQEAANKRKAVRDILPVYKTSTFKRGIYYTADQFMQQQPSDTGFIVLDLLQPDGSRLIHPYYLNKKGKKDEMIKGETYFAIYDNKQWYTGDPSVRMNYENGEFSTIKIFDGITNRAVQRRALAGSIGGSVGGLAGAIGSGAGAVVSVTIFSRSTKSNVGKDSPAFYKAKFDPEYKTFIPIERH